MSDTEPQTLSSVTWVYTLSLFISAYDMLSHERKEKCRGLLPLPFYFCGTILLNTISTSKPGLFKTNGKENCCKIFQYVGIDIEMFSEVFPLI